MWTRLLLGVLITPLFKRAISGTLFTAQTLPKTAFCLEAVTVLLHRSVKAALLGSGMGLVIAWSVTLVLSKLVRVRGQAFAL